MTTLFQDDELLDLVDEQDNVIGQMYRSQVYAEHKSNFRAINGFLINHDHKIWIPRRSPHKRLFPLCLDVSVGGHVAAGETYDEAFKRELQEELNLNLDKMQYRLLGVLTPAHGVSAYMHVYVILYDQTPDYNKNDFVEGNWYTVAEIRKMIASGEAVKGDFPQLIDFLVSTL